VHHSLSRFLNTIISAKRKFTIPDMRSAIKAVARPVDKKTKEEIHKNSFPQFERKYPPPAIKAPKSPS
jgi:hypothetical protein